MAYVLIGVAAVLAIWAAVLFNGLIAKRQMVKNGWADIDVQLKRRAELVPELVSVVQGYAAHERQLFEDIAAKRNAALAAGDDPARRGASETAFAEPIGKLIAVAEAYPELKASQNFLQLQDALADTENKIEMARRFYNGAVRELNTAVETVPGNLIAGPAGVQSAKFFEASAKDAASPQIAMGQS
jgi:LemA protein